MSKLLLLTLLLLVAMLLGPVLINQPGYIKLVVAGYSIEMTVLGLGIALGVLALAAGLLFNILRYLSRWQKWSFNFFRLRRQRKARAALALGLQAYARQQWQQAAELLQQALDDPDLTTEKSMLASYASFYAGKTDQAITIATKLDADSANSAFVKADLYLQQGQADAACRLLQQHLPQAKQDPMLGQLYLQALQQAGQWQLLLETVPIALVERWFSKDSWQQRRFAIYPQAVSQLSLQGFSEQAPYWQNLPAKERKSAAAMLGLAWALAQQGKNEQAEHALVQALTLDDLPAAWPYLRQIPLGRSVLKLRKTIQHWLRDNPTNGYLYAVLAYLAEQEGDKEQAALALQKVRQVQPALWQNG